MENTFDYIIAGGGLSGCVVASRLKQAFPKLSIALIESGPDSRNVEAIASPGNAWMITPDYYHIYHTVPQKTLNNQSLELKAGRALGGGSAVNYGGWTRGDRAGYNEWAEIVGDERWSYNALVPFFKRAETYGVQGLEDQHGYQGPIHPTRGERGYLLHEDVKEAMLSTGLRLNPDANGGDITGVVRLIESWNKNRRTFAANGYDLSGVEILTDCHVGKIVLEGGKATGVALMDGRVLKATKEVIISCGAIRTPQLLMLSGLGPKAELERHAIPVIVESPQIGQNLHDHPILSYWFKLRNPELGLALGSEKFMANPKYLEGNPMDWMMNAGLFDEEAKKAAAIDGKTTSRRDDIEITFIYLSTPTSSFEPPPMDGTHVTTSVVAVHATSRGQISLASADPKDMPLIDPAYADTEHDRAVLREGSKLVAKMMESEAGQRISTGETTPGSFAPLSSHTSDAELDERARACIRTAYHYAGTCAMGEVVDTECRLKGLKGLRVIDASIMPVSMSAHLQASMYGLAERAAQMIIDGTV